MLRKILVGFLVCLGIVCLAAQFYLSQDYTLEEAEVLVSDTYVERVLRGEAEFVHLLEEGSGGRDIFFIRTTGLPSVVANVEPDRNGLLLSYYFLASPNSGSSNFQSLASELQLSGEVARITLARPTFAPGATPSLFALSARSGAPLISPKQGIKLLGMMGILSMMIALALVILGYRRAKSKTTV